MAVKDGLRGIKSIRDFDLDGQRVFIRVDFNVPMDDGEITDDNRIQAALPTIKYAMEKGAKIILGSHFGRPKTEEDRTKFSMETIAARLGELLNIEVLLVDDPLSEAPRGLLSGMKPNQIILLENLRFFSGETKNETGMAQKISEYADIYINDAFGACHRAHTSIVALPEAIRKRGMGLLLEKEIQMLDQVIHNPQKPYAAILGGSKVSDKIGVIENLINKVDVFVIGGAMAYTFLQAKGLAVGKSRVEEDKVSFAKDMLRRVEARDKKLLLPVDHIIVEEFSPESPSKITEGQTIPEGWMGVDIGPKSQKEFAEALKGCKTIFWNGPMGVFEMKPFSSGTFAIAEVLAHLEESTTIVGGGDSAAAAKVSGYADKMTHISTGGGASLEYLRGDVLPGLEALRITKREIENALE